MTRLYGVIGDPIAHSLSPLIHNAWLREHGIDADYRAMQVPAGQLPDALETLTRQGSRGVNITLPHKQVALQLAESSGSLVMRIGAANTLIRTDSGGWHAENTDAPGFVHALESAGIQVAGKRVFLLGAGGSAHAVAVALTDLRAALTICNRTLAHAESLATRLDITPDIRTLEAGLADLSTADIVVNTLSLGYEGGGLDLPPGRGRTFYDINYGRAAAATRERAVAQDWKTLDGLGMLVAQAAFSFEHWFGILPDMAAAEQRCRAVVEATT
ncbi:shikimate dehydrogenase [Hyphomonas johnsonii]|uniref:Shikimate dehydrogenase (NADP(+)) n=1 Tax=Hyphomonas johnsonii MHS-2 TaxID=1280950 RepID=A0A059FMS4_9PROT|nr:shikimate dehydrogenase [Hyphomonas johnsonii]KCZ91773.1 shikimate 5-dehydrogenase [Hyphomonas johnsonii MHS-2]